MSTEDDTSQLGLDDSGLAFVNDGVFGVDTTSDQLANDDITKSLLGPNSVWDFQGSPSFDTYDVSNSSAASAQPEYVTPSWQFSSLDELGVISSNTNASNASPSIDPTGLFASANFVMPSEDLAGARPRSTTTLTPAVHEKLKSIAMPAHFKYTSHASSPESNRSDTKAGIISSPEDADGARSHSRKRKVSSEPEDEEDDDDDKPFKKTAHNMIEKRYRTNINDKIAALRDSVPSLRIMSKSARGEDTTQDREDLQGLTPAHKLNKATVLSKATEYIRHLEKRNNRLLDENGAMQARIAAFEKLFMAGAMNGSIGPVQPSPQMQYSQDGQQQYSGSPAPQQDGGDPPSGMIQVPDDMRRIIAAQMAAGQPYPVPQQSFRGSNPAVIRQQQIQQQQIQQQQQGAWSNASPYFGKLMVGSLAGLMILEAVREDEQSNESPEGRGLFAVPLQLLHSASTSLDLNVNGYHLHTSIKLLLFLGVFLWAFVPSLFRPSNNNPKKGNAAYLRAAPSLASSIDVRRQAWLTAIQTVWVPRHNFFLEAAALMAKTAKLSLRNVIGVHGYQMLTGLTEEEEKGRVKAWSIALDSQLAGGDVDICKSRLVLTLLASGTLPDTPQRLMLKALHIRVLLWDLSRTRLQLGLVNIIAAKLARKQWNEARQLNRLLTQLRDDSSVALEDELPEHLAVLVERDCDEVLTPAVIQRAHNLAFNRETSYDITTAIDGMDSVVEDVYVSSPLDAVAAWWSTEVLHDVLTAALEKKTKTDTRLNDIETAIKAAPVGTVAMLRATLARAILIDSGRGANIATAVQALGSERIESPFRESKLVIGSGSNASNQDLLLTLRCAVAIGQLCRTEGAVVTPSQSLRVIEALLSPRINTQITLLGFTAVMSLLERVMSDKTEEAAIDRSLEKIAGSLRLWMGGSAGTDSGLDTDVRDKVVERCLSITKTLVGMAVDSGHASMSDMSDADSVD